MDDTEQELLGALMEQENMAQKDYIAHAKGSMDNSFATREEIIAALKTVTDPEIMINIYDLGLVYNIEQKENGDIFVDMTVTSPMCPVAGILPQQAADAIALVKGTNAIEVKIVWEPAWSFERLSEEAKLMFEMF